ncbi:MAG: UxaA family hydrolase [Promethearchaeota archaeon]
MSIKTDLFIIMNQKDNCATALKQIAKGTKIEIKSEIFNISQNIPSGHKFALSNIKKGELIIKYGEIIGIATEDINIGDWIHIHNIKSHYIERSK